MEVALNRAAALRGAIIDSRNSAVAERNQVLLECLLELHEAEKQVIAKTENDDDRERRRKTYHEFWVGKLNEELKSLELQTMIVQACGNAVREYTPK